MRREFIVIAILSVLLGYMVYDSLRDDPSKIPVLFSAAKKEDVVPITREQLSRVELIRDNYIVVIEKGRNGKFTLKSPISADVDKEVLDGLLSAFEHMEIKKTLRQDTEEIPLIMSEYGLERPPIVWRFTDANQVENTFLVGKETPERDGFYAKWKDREEILVLPKKLYPLLDLNSKALRDKVIFAGLTDGAVKEIVYRGLHFVKGAEGWALVAPLAVACDQKKMDLFIGALRAMRAQDFTHRELKEGPDVRPDDGTNILTVVTGEGKGKDISQEVRFGSDIDGNENTVTVFKDKVGYVIKKDGLRAFPPEARTFVDSRIVPFEKAAIEKITIGDSDKAFSFVQKDGRWSVDGVSRIAVDADKVGALAEALSAPCVVDVLLFSDENAKKTNLMPPEYIVKVNDRVTVALSTREKDAVYFLREDSKNVIGKAASGIRDFLAHELHFYRDKKLLRVDPRAATKVSLSRDGRDIGIERTDGEWAVTSPVKGKIPQGVMLSLLRPFENLRAIEFVTDADAGPAAATYGLDNPFLTIRVTHAGKEEILSVGKQTSGRFYYASLAGVEGVFLLNRKTVKLWDVDLLKQIYLIEEDVNRDTIVDSWTYFDKGRKTKLEIDVNNDGKPDAVSNFIYNADGALVKVETDNNNDGKVDQTTYFTKGVLDREESDADYNGTIESVTYFKDGKQYKTDIDTSGDGKPDMTKYYTFNEKGEVTGADVDQDMDTKIDYREHYEKGKIIKDLAPVNGTIHAAVPAQSPASAIKPASVTLPPKVPKPKSKEIEL